jgi:hypothetical protein
MQETIDQRWNCWLKMALKYVSNFGWLQKRLHMCFYEDADKNLYAFAER